MFRFFFKQHTRFGETTDVIFVQPKSRDPLNSIHGPPEDLQRAGQQPVLEEAWSPRSPRATQRGEREPDPLKSLRSVTVTGAARHWNELQRQVQNHKVVTGLKNVSFDLQLSAFSLYLQNWFNPTQWQAEFPSPLYTSACHWVELNQFVNKERMIPNLAWRRGRSSGKAPWRKWPLHKCPQGWMRAG